MTEADGQVKAFLDQWVQAELTGDSAALQRQVTDDFVGVGPLGFMLSRQDWLDRFTRGLHIEEFSLTETQVRRYGETAVVIGRVDQAGNHAGQPVPGAARTTLVLVNTADGWRLAGVHYSFIAGAPGSPPLPGRPPGR